MGKQKSLKNWENNLLGWQLAVLDRGFRYSYNNKVDNWEAHCPITNVLRGVWGKLSWVEEYGWLFKGTR